MSVLGNAKSDCHRKTYPVEPDGTGREYMFLLGETCRVRAGQESAEAVVVMTPGESREERRAEESREDHSLHPRCGGTEGSDTASERQLRQLPARRVESSGWIPAAAKRVLFKSPSVRAQTAEEVQ